MKYTLPLFLILILWCWCSRTHKFVVVDTVTFSPIGTSESKYLPVTLCPGQKVELHVNHYTVMDDHGKLIK